MPNPPSPPTSFSARRRWGILFYVALSTVAVLALVAMANYLGARYYLRFKLNTQTRQTLSPQTLGLLRAITNQVKVVVYYQKTDPLYSIITALLDEYRLANPKISVETVDWERDAPGAQRIKDKYRLGSSQDKNLVIFDCNGKYKPIPGDWLGTYQVDPVANEKEPEFHRNLKSFKGELVFSSVLLNVTNPKSWTACYLKGHGEPSIDDSDKDEPGNSGYQKFKGVLQENGIQPTTLSLTGTNIVPKDCDLLIVAGPQTRLQPSELEKIAQYLKDGGRMLVLFNNYVGRNGENGLESILADWGVDVGSNYIRDPENSVSGTGKDITVTDFNAKHPLVNPLLGTRLHLILPRSIRKLNLGKQGPEIPKVDELAFTGAKAVINDSHVPEGKRIPLIVAVEKGNVSGIFTERGLTRIVVAGDSLFLNNQLIEADANRDFAGYAVNWLLEQTQMMQGIGPHSITEYTLRMTRSQMTSVRWLFLAGMPGVILTFGGLVWLRRRH